MLIADRIGQTYGAVAREFQVEVALLVHDAPIKAQLFARLCSGLYLGIERAAILLELVDDDSLDSRR